MDQITVTSEASTRTRASSKMRGYYIESSALAKKYAGKPQQLANVRERTNHKFDSVRGVML